jgi:hypothetical protein
MNAATAAGSLFKDMLDSMIAPKLKGRGLLRRGKSFYLQQDGNTGLVNFQLGVKSAADVTIFTVNLGIASGRLLKFFNSPSRNSSTLHVNDCHWRQRLGFLLPEHTDKWWRIDDEISRTQIGQELCCRLISSAIPEMTRYVTDEALRDLWLSGPSPGLTNLSRLMNLSVLVNEIGPSSALGPVLIEFRRAAENAISPGVVERHLKRLAERREASAPSFS